jgi:hypothetical protein
MNPTIPLALTLLLTACATQPPPKSLPHDLSGINQTLENFHQSASHSSYDSYFKDWTDQSVFLGTDATERWVGDDFKKFAKPYFEKGHGWTYHPRDRHISIAPDGRTAWFDELLDNDKLGQCRGSGVLLHDGPRWLLVQYNLSIPIPNDLAADLTRQIRDQKPAHQE